jgi:hypothetical protein
VPNTRVGRTSAPGRIEVQGSSQTAEVDDFGIEIPVPQDDIDNAPKGVDVRGQATERATNIVLLDREQRVASLVFAAASYPSTNKLTLSGTSQWSDYVNSDPLAAMMAGLDACLVRPNVFCFGQEVWTKLSMHPKIVKASNANAGDAGRATRQRMAELLEVQEVLVGPAFINTVKPGLAATFARVWGKHAVGFYRDRTVTTQGGVTFGLTAQYGTRIAGSKPDDKIGLRGGQAVRAGESVKELILAPQASYFWENAIA